MIRLGMQSGIILPLLLAISAFLPKSEARDMLAFISAFAPRR